jgi:hypothetical protein
VSPCSKTSFLVRGAENSEVFLGDSISESLSGGPCCTKTLKGAFDDDKLTAFSTLEPGCYPFGEDEVSFHSVSSYHVSSLLWLHWMGGRVLVDPKQKNCFQRQQQEEGSARDTDVHQYSMLLTSLAMQSFSLKIMMRNRCELLRQ